MNDIQKLKVSELEFDLKNPRTNSGRKKQSKATVLKELLEESIDELIKSIVNRGFAKSSVFLVVNENGKKIAIDGNRRLLALKIINNEIKLSNQYKNKFKKILDSFNYKYEFINAVVFDKRSDAEKEMAILHLSGEAIRKWKLIRQYRYFNENINSEEISFDTLEDILGVKKTIIKKGVISYQLYEIAKKNLQALNNKFDFDIFNDNHFLMDKFQKFVYAKDRQRFLGYKFDEGLKKIIIEDESKFFNRLEYILEKVFDKNVSAQIKKHEIDKLLKVYDNSWLNETEYKKAIKNEKQRLDSGQALLIPEMSYFLNNKEDADKEFNEPYENIGINKTKTLIKKNRRQGPGINSKKIKEIYKELTYIEVSKCPTAVFALVRILTDISVHEFLSKKGHQFDEQKCLITNNNKRKKSLKEKMDFIASEYLNQNKELRNLIVALNEDYLTKNLNEVMHNTIFLATESKIRDYWKNLLPFLEFLWLEIKNIESNKK
jgi:hypothetical protein